MRNITNLVQHYTPMRRLSERGNLIKLERNILDRHDIHVTFLFLSCFRTFDAVINSSHLQ